MPASTNAPPFKPPILRTHCETPKEKQEQSGSLARSNAAPIATDEPTKQGWFSRRNVFFLGLGMCGTLAVWLAIQLAIIPFIADAAQHWQYGDGRLSQFDLKVGHGGVSHFLAEYWHHEIIIVEFPGGSPVNAKSYTLRIMIQNGNAQHSVTLTTGYIRPHANHTKPDLVITVSDVTTPIILYNIGNAFSTEVP
jgi:hypothetical protein